MNPRGLSMNTPPATSKAPRCRGRSRADLPKHVIEASVLSRGAKCLNMLKVGVASSEGHPWEVCTPAAQQSRILRYWHFFFADLRICHG